MQNERVMRRALVRVSLWLTAGTPLAPTLSERQLLAQFLRGLITLDQLYVLSDGALQPAQALSGLARLATCAA